MGMRGVLSLKIKQDKILRPYSDVKIIVQAFSGMKCFYRTVCMLIIE